MTWRVTFIIKRQRTGEKPYEESFALDVDPDEYVLDAIERIWAFHDRTLTYRHACHHSTCGACGMRVNGVEKLTCITPIRQITKDQGTLRVEPLRNFKVQSDLVVDMSLFFQRMEAANFHSVAPVNDAKLPYEPAPHPAWKESERLVDCIECGLCISACPVSITSGDYLGPAVLAAVQDSLSRENDQSLYTLVNNENGAWRCHSAFECSAVCPSNVDPGWRIMDLRKRTIVHKIRELFRGGGSRGL